MLSSKSLYLRGKHKKRNTLFRIPPPFTFSFAYNKLKTYYIRFGTAKLQYLFLRAKYIGKFIYFFTTRNFSFYALLFLLLLFMEHIPCSLCRRHYQHILNIHMRRLRYGKINRFSNIVGNQILITCIYLIGTTFVSFETN